MTACTAEKRRFPRWLRRLLLILAALAVALLFMQRNLNRVVLAMASANARALTVNVLNQAVQEILDTGVKYDDMMIVQKDQAGRVVLLQANTTLMNDMASAAALRAQASLSSLENQFVSIPLGSALGMTIWAGSGPRIRVQILPVGAVSAQFSTEFQAAGINQTRHKILLTLEATVRLVIPTGAQEVSVSAQMTVAESIIVGQVPDSFVDVNNDSDMLNLIP